MVNSIVTDTPGYLAGGGILPSATSTALNATQARSATSGWLDNQKLGYAINWNFGVQHVFGKDYVAGGSLSGHEGRTPAAANAARPDPDRDRYQLSPRRTCKRLRKIN